jgi:hypothetical protein
MTIAIMLHLNITVLYLLHHSFQGQEHKQLTWFSYSGLPRLKWKSTWLHSHLERCSILSSFRGLVQFLILQFYDRKPRTFFWLSPEGCLVLPFFIPFIHKCIQCLDYFCPFSSPLPPLPPSPPLTPHYQAETIFPYL